MKNAELRTIAVLRSGTLVGFTEYTPVGGHVHPSFNVGASPLWK